MTDARPNPFRPLPPPGRHAEKDRPRAKWQPKMPVPPDAPSDIPHHHRLGKPSCVWDYRDAEGRLLHRIARFDLPDDRKEIVPLCWCVRQDGMQKWRWQGPTSPRPLYGLDRLAQRPSAPVIVPEGEKSADAGGRLFPDRVAITSSGGNEAAHLSDWSLVAGRDVTIFPDHDEAGQVYAGEVARLATAAGAASVRIVQVPAHFPAKWDLAEPLPDGVTPAMLAELLSSAPEWVPTAADPEPQTAPDREHEPTPLVRPMAPAEPFPVEALGALAPVALALHDMVQSPLAMCGNTVLAVATLAAQGHVDVKLPINGGLVHPTSGLFVTVGRSGERKSATDTPAMRAVREREADLRMAYEVEMKAFKIEHDAWEAERRSIMSASGGRDSGKKSDKLTREVDLRALGPEPLPPLAPILVMAEPTIEGLAKLLMTGQPSVGVFSAEGGQFVGGHALSDDAKLRTAAALSNLWDGEAWKRVRAADGAHTIANRRVSMHLLVQPDVAAQLVNDPVLRDQGLVSRMLLTYPASTMGTRLHRAPSQDSLATLNAFSTRLAEALSRPAPLIADTRNELAPRALSLSHEARVLWIEFSDHVERMIGPGGELEPISGFAAKAAEHAARLAAVMTWFADHDAQEIGADVLSGAIQLAEHYASEALRLHQTSVVPPDIAAAGLLLDWLRERWPHQAVSVPDIIRLGPNSVRVARRARELVALLADHGWLIPIEGGATIAGSKRRQAWRIEGRPS